LSRSSYRLVLGSWVPSMCRSRAISYGQASQRTSVLRVHPLPVFGGGLRPRLAEAGLGIDDLSHRLDRGALRIGSARSHEQFDEVLVIYDQKPLAVTHADGFITCGDDSGTTGPTESRGIRLREEGCEFRILFLEVGSRTRPQCLAAYVE
jgi:hypothetical protein